MRTGEDWARERFAEARVARLATSTPDGTPHLVPFVYAVHGSRIISAVDGKPKSSTALRRLANIAANPSVSVLVDHYDDGDWTRLWWARADGRARVLDSYDLGPLVARYRQYATDVPGGPVIAIEVDHWSGWSAAEPPDDFTDERPGQARGGASVRAANRGIGDGRE